MPESQTAAGRYEELASDREPYLHRANECAKYTIPALFRWPRPIKSKAIPTPYQSIGSRGLNNLASKLMLTLLPPNTPCFRYMIDKVKVEKEKPDPEFLSDLEKALGKYERRVMAEVESSGDRVAAYEGFRQLLVAGNVLLYDGKNGMRAYHLDRYVCKRDPEGNPLEIIAKETVSPAALDKDFLSKLAAKAMQGVKKKSAEATLDIYTHIERFADEWTVYQECGGERIPGTNGTYPLDACPWMALRFVREDGMDYGASYVEEYLGDLISLDGFCQALLEGSLASAKMLTLVAPNGQTNLKAVAKARNCAVISGDAKDVTSYQASKFNDLRAAKDQADAIEKRLAYAFLLNTSVQRNAERVTTVETRYMIEELEASLGGAYTLMASEFLLPYIKQKINKMEKAGLLPTLPKELIKPTVVVGIEALGRGTDRAKLLDYITALSTALTPAGVQAIINVDEAAKRLATADGIDIEGLVKTKEEQAAVVQQNQQQGLIDKLGPNAISAAGSLMGKGMDMQGAMGGQPQEGASPAQEPQPPQE